MKYFNFLKKTIIGCLLLLSTVTVFAAPTVTMQAELQQNNSPLTDTKISLEVLGYPPLNGFTAYTDDRGYFPVDSQYVGRSIQCNAYWGYCLPTVVQNNAILYIIK